MNATSKVYTEPGMLRIRWWPVFFAGVLLLAYLGYNVLHLIFIMLGAPGSADPFWNGVTIFLFDSFFS